MRVVAFVFTALSAVSLPACNDDGKLDDLDIVWFDNDVNIATGVEPDQDGLVMFTLTGAAVGQHVIVLRVVDTSGKQGMDSVGITVSAD